MTLVFAQQDLLRQRVAMSGNLPRFALYQLGFRFAHEARPNPDMAIPGLPSIDEIAAGSNLVRWWLSCFRGLVAERGAITA